MSGNETQTRVIRGFAWVDLAITLPFALPFIAEAVIALLYFVDRWLGFGTPSIMFEAGPFGLMFVHIMGVLGVLWAMARLRRPEADLAWMDVRARLAVMALILYAITLGATPVLWLFVVTEVAGSAAQFAVLRQKST
ncbi:MAG: hypothetical protein Q7V31_12520 [Parvibaculum sp.]|uniref:hypothetical protein n=1 Tax=Parvibaculum sp. TaxID=2024848 RepID=UPI00271D3FF3|nr:hypothetical protein [Parvibaculum sp.]MDO8839743.1 hypothetical protein [Parvibaculum sp.]